MNGKKIAKKLLLSSLAAPFRRLYQGMGTVLVYHRITLDRFPVDSFNPEIGLAVHVDEFEQQIKTLSQKYNCINLTELSSRLQSGPYRDSKPFALVTFDDGFKDNLQHALPVLEKYSVPAAIFVTSGFIDGSHEPWWLQTGAIVAVVDSLQFQWHDESYEFVCRSTAEKYNTLFALDSMMKCLSASKQREFIAVLTAVSGYTTSFADHFLSWDEVRTLHAHPLITIGAHTVSHAPLAQCSGKELVHELRESRARLKTQLKSEVMFNAYPYGKKGECGEREFRAAEEAGYLLSCTTRTGHVHPAHKRHLHAIPRIAVDHYMTLEDFNELVLSGLSALIKRKGELVVTQ